MADEAGSPAEEARNGAEVSRASDQAADGATELAVQRSDAAAEPANEEPAGGERRHRNSHRGWRDRDQAGADGEAPAERSERSERRDHKKSRRSRGGDEEAAVEKKSRHRERDADEKKDRRSRDEKKYRKERDRSRERKSEKKEVDRERRRSRHRSSSRDRRRSRRSRSRSGCAIVACLFAIHAVLQLASPARHCKPGSQIQIQLNETARHCCVLLALPELPCGATSQYRQLPVLAVASINCALLSPSTSDALLITHVRQVEGSPQPPPLQLQAPPQPQPVALPSPSAPLTIDRLGSLRRLCPP